MAKRITAVLCILALAFTTGAAEAKDDKGKARAKGADKVKIDKSNSPKVIPPGQIKRYTRGQNSPVILASTTSTI